MTDETQTVHLRDLRSLGKQGGGMMGQAHFKAK